MKRSCLQTHFQSLFCFSMKHFKCTLQNSVHIHLEYSLFQSLTTTFITEHKQDKRDSGTVSLSWEKNGENRVVGIVEGSISP